MNWAVSCRADTGVTLDGMKGSASAARQPVGAGREGALLPCIEAVMSFMLEALCYAQSDISCGWEAVQELKNFKHFQKTLTDLPGIDKIVSLLNH